MNPISETKFDQKIKELIPHYTKYPEMLPFIGKSFEKMETKVILIGESHYFDDDAYEVHEWEDAKKNWYHNSSSALEKWKTNYINTRLNFHIIEVEKEFKKPHTNYWNMRSAIKDSKLALIDNEQIFQNIAYFNYFQRPSFNSGESILNSQEDNEVAFDTFSKLINFLKPKKIIFNSAKAMDTFNWSNKGNELNSKIYRTPHAASSWWNRESSKTNWKTGREYFIQILNSDI